MTKLKYDINEGPIRDEIFSLERLDQYAIYLARNLEVSQNKNGKELLRRVDQNFSIFNQAYKDLTSALQKKQEIPPAGSWLVDNHFIIEDQIREIRKDLPKTYYSELPKIANGDLSGHPRVYSMALALVAHTDSRLEIETIRRFTRAFQTVAPLTSGEIWAIPITLRIVLIENVRRLINQIMHAHEIKLRAKSVAEDLLEHKLSREELTKVFNEMVCASHLSDCICIAQLSRHLRDNITDTSDAQTIINNYLQSKDKTIDEAVRIDHLHQGINQVSIGNIVTSMRLLSSADWKDFFESVSLVEPILASDPCHVYSKMDFIGRDTYRHHIERIAKRCKVDELEVAGFVLSCAERAKEEGALDRVKTHVGHYLEGFGAQTVEKHFNYRPKISELIRRSIKNGPHFFYFGLLLLTFVLFVILYKWALSPYSSRSAFLVFFLLSLVPISDSVLEIVNLLFSTIVPPKILPKIELKGGVPLNARTFVVVPTIFSDEQSVKKIIDSLEVHYLSNQDPNIFFAALSDFADATTEFKNSDSIILKMADQLIADLNARYCPGAPQFYFFHRPRLWNPGEEKWMGWERKRGKLEEFNRFLRELNFDPFIKTESSAHWDRGLFLTFKYVITLDSDTQIPRDNAKKLIGTILHPMNEPKVDQKNKRVSSGYAIFQPRINISPQSSSKTFFSRTYSGHTGIDPYTTAVSDIYQDLFGAGIFVGKGLYDIDAFSECLLGKTKENTILSHDLYESLHARTALVTDIEFLDDYPSHFDSFVKRSHRWIRGDWQIAKWVLPFPGNQFGALDRWKIFDNLRRSLLAPMTLLWLYFSFIISLAPLRFGGAVFFVLFLPALTQWLNSLLHLPKEMTLYNHLLNIGSDFKDKIIQIALFVLFLPHQAFSNVDAIVRALYRQLLSKKKMLEWTMASEAEGFLKKKNRPSLSMILPTEIFVLWTTLSLLTVKVPQGILISVPLLLLWFLFPELIKKMGKSQRRNEFRIDHTERTEIRQIARRTWNFFETFVGDLDHWLPPDNFQEDPRPVTAHRTSPTNMGVLLLSSASAYNFGHLGSLELIERLEKTQSSFDKLEKYKGHFYNWYDTTNLAPLYPIYISTVDSGNLAAYLMTMKNFCLKLKDAPLVERQLTQGMADTLEIVKAELSHVGGRFLVSGLAPKQSANELHELISSMIELNDRSRPATFSEWQHYCHVMKVSLEHFYDVLMALELEYGEAHFKNVPHWTKCAVLAINNLSLQLDSFVPFSEKKLQRLHQEIKTVFPDREDQIDEHIHNLKVFFEKIPDASHMPELCLKKSQQLQLLYDLLKSRMNDKILPKELEVIIEDLATDIFKVRQFSFNYIYRLNNLAERYHKMAMSFDFTFLFNNERKLFSIGYNLTEGHMDNSFYDLLASEARLASFFAIAKGDIPMSHWFHLGRQVCNIRGNRALVSWTASMFEYLMPLLIMRNYSNTLLHQTYENCVKNQIAYTKKSRLPWGVSESAYNARDMLQFYQYGPFGIPGMGLKFGLSSDLVISPYSTSLAAMIAPKAALENFKRLKKESAFANFGFYESIDYTKERLQKGHKKSVIKNFMAHHQGMTLISLNNVIHHNIMHDYFHADPMVKATELLLQEKVPQHMPIRPHRQEEINVFNQFEESHVDVRYFKHPDTAFPQGHLLSNGQYTVMATVAGSGFSRFNDMSINRWSEDPTLDSKGTYFYVQDHFDSTFTSATFQPMKKGPESYEAHFSEHKMEFFKHDKVVSIQTEIIVSPESNVELRRITLINHSNDTRKIDVTSYLEPVLTRGQDDIAHPAFSKLFLSTEFVSSKSALLINRRKRLHSDKDRWGFHMAVTSNREYSATEYETDRLRFIGRGKSTALPLVIEENLSLSNTTGTVLDPILSLRKCLEIAPRSKAKICYVTGLAESKNDVLKLIDQYQDVHAFDREQELAWTQTQAGLRHLQINFEEAHLFQKLASTILHSNPILRPGSEKIQRCVKAQDGLWAFGLSGDIPILLVKVKGERDIPLVKLVLRAHEYLRLKKIPIDLLVINDESVSYRTSLQDELIRQARIMGVSDLLNKNGGIFLFNSGNLKEEERQIFLSYAKIVIDSNKGSLEDQLQRLNYKFRSVGELVIGNDKDILPSRAPVRLPEDLHFFNGSGGFDAINNEYVIYLKKGHHTPAPWINVISNQDNFGFIVSETGNGYTWSHNSRENRLTPWSNDPVNDAAGEALYIRDEETNRFWSVTPWPIRSDVPYLIRHSQGSSQFEYNDFGLNHELLIFAGLSENIKIMRLRIKNTEGRKRRLSATFYAEWVLANNRSQSAHHLISKKDNELNALLAHNPFNIEYSDEFAFCAISGTEVSYTADRKEFLGRNGSYESPLGMKMRSLGSKCGAGLDPCAALRTTIEISPNEEKEIIILIGQNKSQEKIRELVKKFMKTEEVERALLEVKDFWKRSTEVITIETPAMDFDLMMNKWLQYQTLSCRMWARSALYQSGGAFGFRDQLQDSLGLLYTHPEIARAHIIKCAAHQFKEGDVQHWWHPPKDKGVRTRFSDDLLWLPYVVMKYINRTHDFSILEERAPFVSGPLLNPEQEDLYVQPSITLEDATIYEHCRLALDYSLKTGPHDLPLMGAGDWNDGMNNIGLKGEGESVWVAWFLAKILKDFSKLCESRNDLEHADRYTSHSEKLTAAIEKNAWDGHWYLRAFFDDGTPLGSSQNDECQIDSLTQSWSVITGLGERSRQIESMNWVSERLVLKKEKLCLLFNPPFDKGKLNPGYIKGYPPGIRENGGQYSHAAIWASMAYALMGEGDRAFEVLSYINPVKRTNSYSAQQLYKVEPYVLAADIYYGAHPGRGGWSWYTGSSSLFYQAGLEYILGFTLLGDELSFDPSIPKSWREYQIKFKWENTLYEINVVNPEQLNKGEVSLKLDGKKVPGPKIKLIDDGSIHQVQVTMRAKKD